MYGTQASHRTTTLCVSVIYSQRRSRQHTTTFIKHRGKWSQKRNAHPEAYTFINRLPHACYHMTCAALSGCRQTSAATINVLQRICVPLPVLLLPGGRCGRGVVKAWMCRCRQCFPHVARTSALHCSPDSITHALCFHELITGTLEAWQEHGDHTLMKV